MKGDQSLSTRAKHRLRIVARFLRHDGHKFDGGNFYLLVLDAIQGLDEQQQMRLRNIVNWLEQYELAEVTYWGEWRGHSRALNGKSMSAEEGQRASRRKIRTRVKGE